MSVKDAGRTSTQIQEDIKTLVEEMSETCEAFSREENELEKLASLQGNLKQALKQNSESEQLKEESDKVIRLIQDLAPYIKGLEETLSETLETVQGLEKDLKNEKNELEELVYEY